MTRYLATDAEPPAGTKLYDRLGRIWWPLRRYKGVIRWQCNDFNDSDPLCWENMTHWAPFRTELAEPLPESAVTPEIRMWALDFALRAPQLRCPFSGSLLDVAEGYARFIATGERPE